MDLVIKTITCASSNQLPTSTQIQAIPRGIRYEISLSEALQPYQKHIGKRWRKIFPHFSIRIYRNEPKLSIEKRITDQEIIDNQFFFEKCAIDYGVLAKDLIFQLAKQANVPIHEGFPVSLQRILRNRGFRKGTMDTWNYRFHGFHCQFIHQKTGQCIEVPMMYFFEFGELDPYFFTRYIRTTHEYQPLPVLIYDDFYDGLRILKKMLELDLLEYVPCPIETRKGLVAKNRIKSDYTQQKTILSYFVRTWIHWIRWIFMKIIHRIQ